MIYIKNVNVTQQIFIPRNELQKEAYVTSTKTYEDGYKKGYVDGKEYQKDQLLNLYVTQNGEYNREDGFGTVTVDIPIGECPECDDCDNAYNEGYKDGYNQGLNDCPDCPEGEDCTGVYEEGYNKGYDEGYNQGQAECPECGECPELTELYVSENGVYEGAFNRVDVSVPQKDGECNLEDKIIEPSTSDLDGNWLNIMPSEGYDGLMGVSINTNTLKDTWYNEGVEEGRNQGGGSGDCNIQIQKKVDLNGEWEVYYPDEGYDGVYEVVVDASGRAEEWREEGMNDVRNKLNSIEITENGRYSIEDQELKDFEQFDGKSWFDTGIVPTENTKIEVQFRTQGEMWYEDMYVLGCSQIDIRLEGGALNGRWAEARSENIAYSENEWVTAYIDRDNFCNQQECTGWFEGDKDVGWGGYIETIKIGKVGDEQLFKQQIAYVKIWTDKNDDSTMTLFRPKGMAQGGFGKVNSEGTEYDYVVNIGDGTVSHMSEWVRKYGEGWKEINVNIEYPSVQEQMSEYYFAPITVADSGFGERAKEFSVLDETMISNDEGILYGDRYIYIPSSSNKNVIKTKVNVDRMTFPFEGSDSMYMGKIWVEDGVGAINFNGLNFNNLYYLETSADCDEIKLTNCTLSKLNTLVIRSAAPVSYDFSGTIFKNGGVLKVSANLTNAEEIRAALGNGWTITIE